MDQRSHRGGPESVSERRGSALVPVNAAYTSQTCHRCGDFGRRSGDRFHCTRCGVVWQADVNAAINILHRAGDPDIALHTPHQRVKQILQDRTDRHRTRLPVQDSSPATAGRRAKHPNCSAMSNE
ncbi:transposase [Micromonospora sp. CB01531]|uniref:transposase n=1 Tax=Micromonospora sp. CB01531 TaxID=1718947 RepID=UPI003FD566D6